MQIVIDIPEETYNEVCWRGLSLCPRDEANLVKAIRNSTLLSEHHGRLIDADAYRKELLKEIPNIDYDCSLEPYEEGRYSAIMSLDDAPTIIEGSEA